MRTFQLLDEHKTNNGTLSLCGKNDTQITLVREGARVAIAVCYGPLELDFRLEYDELKRKVQTLKPVKGLSTTRQVGDAVAYIALGVTEEGGLVLRPTLINDATGHLTMNLYTNKAIFDRFVEWLAG